MWGLPVATIGRHEPETRQARFCPECGHPTEGRYCTVCGHDVEAYPESLEPRVQGTAAQAAKGTSRSGVAVVAAGAALVLAGIAAAAIILLTGSGTSAHPGSYQRQATAALTPVVSANQKLSAALGGLDGSPSSVTAAQNVASANESAIVAARGALSVLKAPAADATLSQQAQQALDQDSGYVQAVSSILKTPVSQSSSQIQTLSTGAQTAMVSLNGLVPSAGDSVGNTSNLLSWVAGANELKKNKDAQNAQSQSTGSTTSTTANTIPPPSTTSPQPNLSPACGDPNISINGSTSCGFANAVFAQYAVDVQQGGAGSYDVVATSPSTGAGYTDNCQLNSTTQIVDCSHGSDLIQFPEWAAAVYNPGGN
jgi:hypothetical protein